MKNEKQKAVPEGYKAPVPGVRSIYPERKYTFNEISEHVAKEVRK